MEREKEREGERRGGDEVSSSNGGGDIGKFLFRAIEGRERERERERETEREKGGEDKETDRDSCWPCWGPFKSESKRKRE